MCEPTTIAIGASLIGAGVSAYSQYKSGEANAETARANAVLAGKAADDAIQRGSRDASLVSAKTTGVIGAQRAAAGANGIDIQSGTPLQLMTQTRAMGAYDEETVRNNAAREAWGYRAQGANYQRQATQDENAAMYGAAGSLIGGAGGAAGYSAAKVPGRSRLPTSQEIDVISGAG